MSTIMCIRGLTSQKRYVKIRIQLRTYVWIMLYVGIYNYREFYPLFLPLTWKWISLWHRLVAENYCRFTIGLSFKKSNFCGRHFNRKNAVWGVGFIVVQFFKYNLQFNKRMKSARRRLPFNGRLEFVRIFLFLDKNKEVRLCKKNRQFNTVLRLMP